MSNPKCTRTEPATEADQRDPNIGGDQPPSTPYPNGTNISQAAVPAEQIAQIAAELDDDWNALTPAERAAKQRKDRLDYMTELAFLALLHNPRFEQIARLPAADAARHGIGLYDYASRLVDRFLNAQEYAK